MAKFKTVEAHEVWIHNKRVGFVVEQWFYPAPAIQLGPEELEEIAQMMKCGVDPEILKIDRGSPDP